MFDRYVEILFCFVLLFCLKWQDDSDKYLAPLYIHTQRTYCQKSLCSLSVHVLQLILPDLEQQIESEPTDSLAETGVGVIIKQLSMNIQIKLCNQGMMPFFLYLVSEHIFCRLYSVTKIQIVHHNSTPLSQACPLTCTVHSSQKKKAIEKNHVHLYNSLRLLKLYYHQPYSANPCPLDLCCFESYFFLLRLVT